MKLMMKNSGTAEWEEDGVRKRGEGVERNKNEKEKKFGNEKKKKEKEIQS